MKIDTNKPLAIVMCRNYSMRLGMIRAAGMAGCDVVVIQTLKRDLQLPIDTVSKYVVESKLSREPDGNALIETIMGYRNDERPVILLPSDDWTASVVDSHLDLLSPYFLMPHVEHRQGAMLDIMDKWRQKELAKAAGANVAKGWICHRGEQGYLIPDEVTYPCFTKPVESYTSAMKDFLRRCNNKQQLKDLLQSIPPSHQKDILLEEYHPIDKEYAVLGLSLGDRSIIPAFIQMENSLEGVTATGSVHPIAQLPGIGEVLSRFMVSTHLTGLFDIDLYESGGKTYFNELNARFGASGFAVTKGVVNLPGLFIWHLLGEPEDSDIPSNFPIQTFVNEKVCFDMLYEGFAGYRQYKQWLNNADIRFIHQPDDPEPTRMFEKETRCLFLRLLVWRLKKKRYKLTFNNQSSNH
ncbi:MAG: hypothetical protein J5529_11560 [Prevotella sp.]|nr:hypothetical protein [Prevotella sp.]